MVYTLAEKKLSDLQAAALPNHLKRLSHLSDKIPGRKDDQGSKSGDNPR
jgi:hypothetical protein